MKTQSSALTWTWTLDFDLGFVNNTSFSDELIKLIKDRMDFRSKSMLNSSSLPGVPEEEKTLTGEAKNVGTQQSNLESYSLTDSGGGVISDPADKDQLGRAYEVLKNTIALLGLTHESDGKTLEEKILRMIMLLKNESLNLVTRIFGYDKLVLPFSISTDFVLKYCKLNSYVFVSNSKSFVIKKRSQLRINLELFINFVGHISLIAGEMSQIEIYSPLLCNTLMYSVNFVDVINFGDEDFIMQKDSKLVKLNLHKNMSEVIFRYPIVTI